MILAASITIIMWVLHNSVPCNLCSPFLDPTKQFFLIEMTTYAIIAVHFLSVVFILSSYIILIKELKKSQNILEHATSNKNTFLTMQILILTSSNILCWIPSDVIYLMSIFMDKYPMSILTWNTIAITTINSIINPIVFVVTTFRKVYLQEK